MSFLFNYSQKCLGQNVEKVADLHSGTVFSVETLLGSYTAFLWNSVHLTLTLTPTLTLLNLAISLKQQLRFGCPYMRTGYPYRNQRKERVIYCLIVLYAQPFIINICVCHMDNILSYLLNTEQNIIRYIRTRLGSGATDDSSDEKQRPYLYQLQ